MDEQQLYQRLDTLAITLASHLQSPQYSEVAWKNVRLRITNALLDTAVELRQIAGTELASDIREFKRG